MEGPFGSQPLWGRCKHENAHQWSCCIISSNITDLVQASWVHSQVLLSGSFPKRKEYIQGIKFLFQKGKRIYFQKNDKKERHQRKLELHLCGVWSSGPITPHPPRHSTFGQSCGAQLLVRKRCAFRMLFTFLYVSSSIEKGGGPAANGYLEL